MPPSVGRVTAAEQPTEVDACIDFGRPEDSPCGRLRVSGRPRIVSSVIEPGRCEQENPMLTRLAHVTVRYRWAVIGCWLVLVVVGGFAAGKVSTRWYQSFSIPGQSAYQANQRTLRAFGAGVRPPSVVVFHTNGDATKDRAIARRCAARRPGCPARCRAPTSRPQPGIRLARPPYDVHGALPARAGNPHHQQRCGCHPSCGSERAARRDHGRRDRPRSAPRKHRRTDQAAAPASSSRRWSAASARW